MVKLAFIDHVWRKVDRCHIPFFERSHTAGWFSKDSTLAWPSREGGSSKPSSLTLSHGNSMSGPTSRDRCRPSQRSQQRRERGGSPVPPQCVRALGPPSGTALVAHAGTGRRTRLYPGASAGIPLVPPSPTRSSRLCRPSSGLWALWAGAASPRAVDPWGRVVKPRTAQRPSPESMAR